MPLSDQTANRAATAPLEWEAMDAMPLPPDVPQRPYGAAPQQFGELRLPEGQGPFPVVLLIHGGCWRAKYDLVYISRLAAWLASHGWASWSIEYRRVGDAGGGWPGTLLDVAHAADALRTLAQTEALDLTRVVAAGHSAGGHLALWLAARAGLPSSSPLYMANPLPLAGVLGLAAISDLESYRAEGPAESCNGMVDMLMGGSLDAVPQRFAEASPLARLPLRVPMAFVQGEEDDTVSADSVRRFVAAATAAGDTTRLWSLPGAGHYDVAVAHSSSEPALLQALAWLKDL
ncbi:alpha/beta hydrolase family protein [Variovorax sp. HJSM1_2]